MPAPRPAGQRCSSYVRHLVARSCWRSHKYNEHLQDLINSQNEVPIDIFPRVQSGSTLPLSNVAHLQDLNEAHGKVQVD